MADGPADVAGTEAVVASAAAALAAAPARPDTPAAGLRKVHPDQKADETPSEYWVRKTAGATMFIAWIIGLAAAAAVILGIVAAVEFAHLTDELYGGGGGGVSNCLSQGGTDASC